MFAIAKKSGMTRVFDAEGKVFAATKVKLIPLKISQVIKKEKAGYDAIQVEVVEEKETKQKKAYKTEFQVEDISEYKVGDSVSYENIAAGDTLQVEGTGKGKGFAGVIKRHGFSRGPMGHGSNHHRAPGSIGGGYPQRVVAGRKMPGRLGGKHVTAKNLSVFGIDAKSGELLIQGSIPGANNSRVRIIVTKKAE